MQYGPIMKKKCISACGQYGWRQPHHWLPVKEAELGASWLHPQTGSFDYTTFTSFSGSDYCEPEIVRCRISEALLPIRPQGDRILFCNVANCFDLKFIFPKETPGPLAIFASKPHPMSTDLAQKTCALHWLPGTGYMYCTNTVKFIWQKTDKKQKFEHNKLFVCGGERKIDCQLYQYVIQKSIPAHQLFENFLSLLEKTWRELLQQKWLRVKAMGPYTLGLHPGTQNTTSNDFR